MSVPFYFGFPIFMLAGIGYLALSVPPVANQFMSLFGVGFGGLSIFLSSYYWTHSFAQVPAGLVVDRIGAFRALLLCGSISAICCLIPLLAPESFALGIGARLVLGVSTGGLFLVTVKIVKLTAPPRFITRVQGAQGAAFSLGTMLPYLTLPFAGSYGWIVSYIICALFCATAAACAFRLPLRALARSKNTPTARQTWESIKIIAVSKTVWLLGCAHGFAFSSLTSVIGNWLPAILVDKHPGSLVEHWGVAVSILLLVGTVGRLLGGEVARKMPRTVILRRVVLAVCLCHLGIAFFPGPVTVIGAALIMAFVCGCSYAAIFTLAIDTAPPAYVATSVGFMNMVANIINVSIIVLLGLVRDVTGSFAPGLCLTGVGAFIFWFVSRREAASLGETYR